MVGDKKCQVDDFTKSRENDMDSPTYAKFSVAIDSKGRITLPSGVRKTFGLNSGNSLEMLVSISERKVVIRLGAEKSGDENGPSGCV